MMALFPASNIGLFVSFNTDTGGGVASAVMDEFIDRYFTASAKTPPAPFSKDYLARFSGKYRVNRYAYHDMTTVASMFNDATITVEDSTKLRLSAGENVRILEPVDSLTFREKNKSRVFAFRKNNRGEITLMFQGSTPIMAFDKVTGLRSAELHIFIFVAAIVTSIVVLLFWPIVSWSRVGYQSHRMTKPLPYSARFVAWTNFLLLVIFYASFALLANEDNVVNGLPTSLKILLWVPFVNLILTLIMVVWWFRVITVKYHRLISRVYYTIICVVAVAAFWQLYYWNLIGPSY